MAGLISAVERRINKRKEDEEVGQKKKMKLDTSTVNRDMTCPLLLRVFPSSSRHNSLGDFTKGNVPSDELQMHTWMDATLKELAGLVKQVNPEASKKGTHFAFVFVYPDLRTSSYRSRDVGTIVAGQKGKDDRKTLADCNFIIGDYVDVAVIPPGARKDGIGMERMDFDHRRVGGVKDRLKEKEDGKDRKEFEPRRVGGVKDRLGERRD